MSNASESLRSLTKNEQCEQIAQVAHQKGVTMRYLHRSLTQKWATMSESLRSLSKNERMSESVVFWGNSSFYNFFAKNEWFTQKTDERIPNPVYYCTVLIDERCCHTSLSQLLVNLLNAAQFGSNYIWVNFATIQAVILYFNERPEQIAHCRSFLVSDLSNSLTSLIFSGWPDRFAHIAH